MHQLPGSSALYDELVIALGARRPVFAIDLPGHGESDPLPGNRQGVEEWAEAILGALDGLGIEQAHLYLHGSAAAAGVETARRAGPRIRSLMLDGPAIVRSDLAERYAPDLTPSWEGAHLLRAWHFQRDQELWWPWFDRSRKAIRASTPRIDPVDLTRRVREVLKQPGSCAPALRAALAWPVAERLRDVSAPVALLSAPQDAFATAFPAVQAARPDGWSREIEDRAESRAAALEAFLSTLG